MPFQYTVTSSGFWRSLTLVHAWQTPIDATWNVPSWSISAEWAAYLAFPLIRAVIGRVSRASALLATVAALYLLLMWALSRLDIPGARAVGMLRIAAEFTAGVALHRLWTMRRVAIAPLPWLALMLGVAIALETCERFQALPLLPVLACPIVYGLANREALAAGATLVAISAAALCYRLVEQPARRAMLGMLRPAPLSPRVPNRIP